MWEWCLMVQLHSLLSTKFRSWLFRVFLCLGSLVVRAGVQLLAAEGLQAGSTTGAYKLLLGSRWWGWGSSVCLQCAGFHSCTAVVSEWRKGKGVRMWTIILQSAFITGLRQWTTFFLSSLWVGWGHLPVCCNTKFGEALPKPMRRLVLVAPPWLTPSGCSSSSGTLKCFPALNPKEILGLHLPPPLYRAPITHHCCQMALWSPWGGHDPGVIPSWLCFLTMAFTPSKQPCCAVLPAWGKHLRAPPLLCSGLASAACWWPCPSSCVFYP